MKTLYMSPFRQKRPIETRWPRMALIATSVLCIGSAAVGFITPASAQRAGGDARLVKLEQQVAELRSQVDEMRKVLVISGSGVWLKGSKVKIEATAGDIAIQASDDLSASAADRVTWSSGGSTKLSSSYFEVNSGSVKANSAMTTFSGALKSDTLITNSVVSGSYTPGAGNLW